MRKPIPLPLLIIPPLAILAAILFRYSVNRSDLIPNLFASAVELLAGFLIAMLVIERRQRSEARRRSVLAFGETVLQAHQLALLPTKLTTPRVPISPDLGEALGSFLTTADSIAESLSEAAKVAAFIAETISLRLEVFGGDTSSELRLALTNIQGACRSIAAISPEDPLPSRARSALRHCKLLQHGLSLADWVLGFSSEKWAEETMSLQLNTIDSILKDWDEFEGKSKHEGGAV